MRLSTAMLLGSVEGLARCHINHCALGAALNACGVAKGLSSLDLNNRYREVTARWPWTQSIGKLDSIPLNNPLWGRRLPYISAIMDLFDNCVMPAYSRHPTMTFEELVDWVRLVEPECETCCKFTCTCPKSIADSEVRIEVANESQPKYA